MKNNWLWPNNKKVAVTIRDDDISYFTEPWMLDTIYKQAWKLGFKISLAVVPNICAANSSNIPKAYRGEKNLFSISENRELTDYLLKKVEDRQVEIIQHGYSHNSPGGEAEWALGNYNKIYSEVKKGNEILRDTFKREVTVFASPYERISRPIWKSLQNNGLNLCRKFTLGKLMYTTAFSGLTFNKMLEMAVSCNNPFKLIPQSVINIANTVIVQWDFLISAVQGLNPPIEKAKEKFERRLLHGESFIILHHFWEYFENSGEVKQDLLKSLNSFLKFVSTFEGVWKTGLSEICYVVNRGQTV